MDKKTAKIKKLRTVLKKDKTEIIRLKKITLYLLTLVVLINVFCVFFFFKMITSVFGTSIIILIIYLLYYFFRKYMLEENIDNLKTKIYHYQKL